MAFHTHQIHVHYEKVRGGGEGRVLKYVFLLVERN